MVSAHVPSPIAGGCGLLRKVRTGTSCVGLLASISYLHFTRRQVDLTPWVPAPLSWRRRSRYLPVARRSAVARAARCWCGLADLPRHVRPSPSCGGSHFLDHPSMPRDRGVGGMSSSSAFPICPRHPDLAQPQQRRSCPLPAPAVTRLDHAQYPYQCRREGGGFQRSPNDACHSGSYTDFTRDRIPAPAPGAGFRSYFKIDTLAAHPGAYLSRTGQALGAGYRLARGGHPTLDRTTRPVWVNGMAESGDWFGSELRRWSRIDRVGADPPLVLRLCS